jgi:hypothetical protein
MMYMDRAGLFKLDDMVGIHAVTWSRFTFLGLGRLS